MQDTLIIPSHNRIDTPVVLSTHSEHMHIVVQAGAQVVLHDLVDPSANRTVTVVIEDNAHVAFLHDRVASQNVREHYSVDMGRASSLVYYSLLTDTNELQLHMNLKGEYAQADVRCAWLLKEHAQVAMQVNQNHYAPHTTSRLDIRTVLYDAAQAEYQGGIFIAPGAHQTDAAQQHKSIVLSSQARAISVPTIEVLAHDVQCAHGSAVGQIDEEQLLYMQSRGLSQLAAKHMWLRGFFADVFKDSLLFIRLQNLLKMP